VVGRSRQVAALLTCVTALLVPAARASGSAIENGFEDGPGAWQTTGLWHVQDHPESVAVSASIGGLLSDIPAGATLPAAASGTHAAWFGDPATGTYCSGFADVKQHRSNGCTSAGVVAGTLTSPAFTLSPGAASMRFSAWWEINGGSPDVTDLMLVEYSADGGETWTEAGRLNPPAPPWGSRHQVWSEAGHKSSGGWNTYSADLSAVAGRSDVRVRFRFDSVDEYGQGFRGLVIDDVVIEDVPGGEQAPESTPASTDTQLIAGVRFFRDVARGPERGHYVVIEPVNGRSSYTLPGAQAATRLVRRTVVPVGTIVDSREGLVGVTASTDDAGGTQNGTFRDGVFQILQRPDQAIVDLVLRGGSFPHCDGSSCDTAASRARVSAVRRIRRLWGSAHGKFRTRGRYACATIRGTNWLVEDRSNGTFVRVRKGVVVVTDHGLQHDVVVREGETYFARALITNKQASNPRFKKRYSIVEKHDGRAVHVYERERTRVVVDKRH